MEVLEFVVILISTVALAQVSFWLGYLKAKLKLNDDTLRVLDEIDLDGASHEYWEGAKFVLDRIDDGSL